MAPLASANGVPSVLLDSNSQIATAGYYHLSWHADGHLSTYRLLEADTPRFTHSKVIYQGPDLATVISGKPNGKYYYRVALLEEGKPIAVSNTVEVDVVHHSLTKAFTFFSVGALVFLATLVMILRGNRSN